MDAPGVRCLGYVDDMEKIYEQADVVVNCSWHEGFGYTLLEGAAKGCCILSADIPGPNIIFSKWMRSQLFESMNASELSLRMTEFSQNKKRLYCAKILSLRSAKRFLDSKIRYPGVTS